MKKTILSIAVIAAAIFAASCQKENLQENTASEGSAFVFTASIETGANTKTFVERIDGTPATYKTKWESTDQISIDGSIYTATPDDTDKTKATFNKTSGADPTAPFHAYFPARMYSDSKATLPETYDYEDGKYNMPMYAQSETTSLSFKNLCGVLAITVNGTDFTSVSSIEVSSDQQMNGEFTATTDGVLTFASTTLTDALKRVTLTFASAKAIASDGSATFYIPVPAGTHNPLTIDISNGTITKTMVTKKSGGVAVERNKVYSIDFNPNYNSGNHNYVVMKMGTNGDKRLKWATMNISTTDSNPQNIYFAWGDTDGQTWGESSWSGSGFYSSSYTYPGILESLPKEKDAAYKKWGNPWRMPTSAEFQDLYDACIGSNGYDKNTNPTTGRPSAKGVYWCESYDGVKGVLFYDGTNKVFFPVSGYGENNELKAQTWGYYWSSTSANSDKANTMGFTSTGIVPVSPIISAYRGNLVRPVSN